MRIYFNETTKRKAKRSQQGLTVLQLMGLLAVLGIAVTLALKWWVPAFAGMTLFQ